MAIRRLMIYGGVLLALGGSSAIMAQEKKLDRIRVGGGSASAAQMSIWFAKEGNYYDKHGLNVEVISIPGSSLAIQAMLSGELPSMIHLYRRPLLDEWVETGVSLEALVTHVIVHEVGHHFGFSDADMHAIEDQAG